MADIFISYTSSDRDWAFWVGHELIALGHTPHIHEWEIPGGGDIAAWMEQRHHAADHILCIVSGAYLEKPYSSWERRAAQWAAVTDRRNFALPVFIEPCKPPTLLAHLKRCDLYGVSEDVARARLKAFLTPIGIPPREAFPGRPKASSVAGRAPSPFPGKAAVSNISIGVPLHFMGRDDALAAIATGLRRDGGRVAITTLHGMRGVGKSTLAAAYAERCRGNYRATWWIRAQTEATIRADLVGLGVRLGWVGADEDEDRAVETVMQRLPDEGEGIFLIFDNAVDAGALKSYLPRSERAQVLVTSNSHVWRGVATPLEIRVWPKEIGADFLIARTGRDRERQPAEALSVALGGLPLAHEQAAAYCERLEVSLADYLKRFEAAPAQLLGDARHVPCEYHDGLTVAKTFALAIDEAARLHRAAEPLIVHAALLAPEPIPLFLFAEGRFGFGWRLRFALSRGGLDDAVAALRTFALVDRETIVDERDPAVTTDTIRVHPLVRQVAQARRTGKARERVFRALVRGVNSAYPPPGFIDDPKTWPKARRLDGIALSLVSGEVPLPKGIERWTLSLLDSLGLNRYRVLADQAQARPLLERALTIAEKVYGPQHRNLATILNNLAAVMLAQNDLARARPLLERVSAIYKSHSALSMPIRR